MLQRQEARDARTQRHLAVTLARSTHEIRQAQQLRWRVFADELGARLESPEPGLDQDRFDAHCEHLVVIDETLGTVVGTYRILRPETAQRIGGYYSEGEFDLGRLLHLRSSMVEIGRSCIDPAYRHNAAVITLLWSGLARFMTDNGYDHLIGCASIGMADGGHGAAGIFDAIGAHLCGAEYRVFPRCRLPLERLERNVAALLPPLLKGYLRAGAKVCGEPAWDPDFNTADLLMWLPMSGLDARYARHFLAQAA